VFLLSPIWVLCSFILLPFIHLASAIINIVTFPFSVKWLDRIEVWIAFARALKLAKCALLRRL
jgi:hypothetical protein